jgi:hypothetical protein
MNKTVKLTIGERLAALRVLDGFKGTMLELSAILEDVKGIAVSEAEKIASNFKVNRNEAGEPQTITWDERPENEKEVDLKTETAAYLSKAIKDKSDKGEVTLADATLIGLSSKIS